MLSGLSFSIWAFIFTVNICLLVGGTIYFVLKIRHQKIEFKQKKESALAQQCQDIHREKKEKNLIFQATDIAAEAECFDEALQRYVNLICDTFMWPVGHVYKISEKDPSQLLPTKIWYLQNREKIEQFKSVSEHTHFYAGVGLPGRILASGEPAWIEDVKSDQNFPRNKLCSNIQIHAAFGIPVIAKARVLAVLEFFSFDTLPPDIALMRLGRALGRQLGEIYQKREAVEAIAHAEEKSRLLLESAGEGIFGLDTSGNATFINPTALRMLGYTTDEIIGRHMHKIILHSHEDGKPYPEKKMPYL